MGYDVKGQMMTAYNELNAYKTVQTEDGRVHHALVPTLLAAAMGRIYTPVPIILVKEYSLAEYKNLVKKLRQTEHTMLVNQQTLPDLM